MPSRTAQRLRDFVVGLALSIIALILSVATRGYVSWWVAANTLVVIWLAYGTTKAARSMARARRAKRIRTRVR